MEHNSYLRLFVDEIYQILKECCSETSKTLLQDFRVKHENDKFLCPHCNIATHTDDNWECSRCLLRYHIKCATQKEFKASSNNTQVFVLCVKCLFRM